MKAQRELLTKETFLRDIVGLPAKDIQQVMAKLSLIVEDPTPDGKFKQPIKHMRGRLYRARSGNYRILYSYDNRFVNVLMLRRRNEATYR